MPWDPAQLSPEEFANVHPEIIPALASGSRETAERFQVLGRLDPRLAQLCLVRWGAPERSASHRLAVAAALIGTARAALQRAAVRLGDREPDSATEIEVGCLGGLEAELRLAEAGLRQAAELIDDQDSAQLAAAMAAAGDAVAGSALAFALSSAAADAAEDALLASWAVAVRAISRSAGSASGLINEVAAGLVR